MAQQTAVKWLIEQISEKQPNGFYVIDTLEDVKRIFEKAKQMEKEQKIMFAKHCLDRALDLDIRTAHCNLEKYYSETYNR